jgi:hypothetical protein
MKTLTIVAVAFVVVIFALIAARAANKSRQHTSSPPSQISGPAPNDIYLGLRNQMLQSSRATLGLPNSSDPTEPWAVLMDWKIQNGSVTVVAISDGNASVYLSSGGGFIGGFSHESIRKAAQLAVHIASEVQPQLHATTNYPLPPPKEVTFYVLTDSGVLTASAPEEDLKSGRSPLSKLANAAQEVITQYRIMQEGK